MINQLSISYKCQSSIGNSLILDEMIKEVLITFSEETDALHSAFYLFRNSLSEYICSIGKKVNYEIDLLLEKSSKDTITLIKHSESLTLILYRLEDGFFVFIYDELIDINFIKLVFESLRKRLDISINACLNVKELEDKNRQLKILTLNLKPFTYLKKLKHFLLGIIIIMMMESQ